ncbi:MAG: FHA domain-containing protein, partial [Rubripirellula sp.]
MKKPPSAPSTDRPAANPGAYLVLASAGRWSDVFRLAPPVEAVIGRASSNQIVIRSDQASRRHARIEWVGEGWQITDQGSRNGTYVNGQKIEGSVRLNDRDLIEIAGFGITFTHRIEGGSGDVVVDSGQATDDQLTMEVDPASITDRRRHSSYLHARSGSGAGLTSAGANDSAVAASRKLLQLAFTLARAEDAATAIDHVLESIAEQVSFDTAGLYAWE